MSSSNLKWQRWLSLGLPFPLVVLNGWLALQVIEYFQPLVTIFILAALLALILSYPVQFLLRYNIGRNLAITLVFFVVLIVLVTFGIAVAPILLREFSDVAKVIPDWLAAGRQQFQLLSNWAVEQNLPVDPSQALAELAEQLPNEIQSFSQQTLGVVLEAVDSVSDVFLILVLTIYLLLDGDRLWQTVFQRLPAKFAGLLQQSLPKNFQNYFIGQVALATLVGTAMTLAFLFLKVPFGLLFGVGIGFLSLIPFGDTVGFFSVSLLVTYQDFWLGVKTLVVTILVDQVIDQIIAPRILGSFTGLKPIWVLVALLLGTKIAGLLGLLIAVPMAGFIKSTIDSLPPATTSSNSDLEPL